MTRLTANRQANRETKSALTSLLLLFINPQAYFTWPRERHAAVLNHEIQHLHHKRIKTSDDRRQAPTSPTMA